MFIPPLNMGQFQPSPATMSQWIYQIWNFLQENPIATETEIREFIQSELTQSSVIGDAVDAYLTENPPQAPVQSVQGKTGAVVLQYADLVQSGNNIPVYRASYQPTQSTLRSQYLLGFRLYENTSTRELYALLQDGSLELIGRGKIDGTNIDLNTSQGDTTINEAFTELSGTVDTKLNASTFTAYSPATIYQERVTGSLNYTKIGNWCFVRGLFNAPAAVGGGIGIFTGLPVPAIGTAAQGSATLFGGQDGSTTTMGFYVNTQGTLLTCAALTAGNWYNVNGVYRCVA